MQGLLSTRDVPLARGWLAAAWPCGALGRGGSGEAEPQAGQGHSQLAGPSSGRQALGQPLLIYDVVRTKPWRFSLDGQLGVPVTFIPISYVTKNRLG